MRQIIFYIFVATVFMILIQANHRYGFQPRMHLHEIALPDYIHPIPGKHCNYRSAQLSAAQMDSLFNTGIIRRVIRLNAGDAAGIQKERDACATRHIAFYQFQTTNTASAADSIHALLLQGRTLIHCLDGFSQTGPMVGYHLLRQGYTKAQIIQYNKQ